MTGIALAFGNRGVNDFGRLSRVSDIRVTGGAQRTGRFGLQMHLIRRMRDVARGTGAFAERDVDIGLIGNSHESRVT